MAGTAADQYLQPVITSVHNPHHLGMDKQALAHVHTFTQDSDTPQERRFR